MAAKCSPIRREKSCQSVSHITPCCDRSVCRGGYSAVCMHWACFTQHRGCSVTFGYTYMPACTHKLTHMHAYTHTHTLTCNATHPIRFHQVAADGNGLFRSGEVLHLPERQTDVAQLRAARVPVMIIRGHLEAPFLLKHQPSCDCSRGCRIDTTFTRG
jgi:hypothetical protein